MWWAITWPILLAVWAFLFGLFACYYHGRSGTAPVRGSLRWVAWISIGICGLIVVFSFPTWLDWGRLYSRGVHVRAKVVSTNEEYDSILERSLTHVTYQFQAEVGGQLHQFQREGTLPGRYMMVSGFINVLYDSADPGNSRMIREFHRPRDGMATAAVFLALGVVSFLLSRGPRRAGTSPPKSGAVV